MKQFANVNIGYSWVRGFRPLTMITIARPFDHS